MDAATLVSRIRALLAEFETGTQPPQPDPQPHPEPQPHPQPQPPVPGAHAIPWGEAISWKSRDHGGFKCEQILVFALQVPADVKATAQPGHLAVSEFDGPLVTRQLMLSREPGSFDLSKAIAQSQGNTASIWYGIGRGLTPGQTVYFNIRNFSTDLNRMSCDEGTLANIIVNIQPPH